MDKIMIFGGSGGLGKNLAAFLEQDGYEVRSLSSKDVDVKSPEQVEDILKTRFDAVINMAVQNRNGMLVKQSEEDIKTQIDTNVLGSTHIFKVALRRLKEQGVAGRIIQISSILSLHPVPGTSVYSACKAYMDNLVRATSQEAARFGITVNSLQLGYFDCGLWDQVPEEFQRIVLDKVPLHRTGRVEELHNAIKFILNTQFLTGANITLAGGLEAI